LVTVVSGGVSVPVELLGTVVSGGVSVPVVLLGTVVSGEVVVSGDVAVSEGVVVFSDDAFVDAVVPPGFVVADMEPSGFVVLF
jgi:hypothetical protein